MATHTSTLRSHPGAHGWRRQHPVRVGMVSHHFATRAGNTLCVVSTPTHLTAFAAGAATKLNPSPTFTRQCSGCRMPIHHWRYDARVYACVKRMCVPSIQHDTPRWWSACMYTPPKAGACCGVGVYRNEEQQLIVMSPHKTVARFAARYLRLLALQLGSGSPCNTHATNQGSRFAGCANPHTGARRTATPATRHERGNARHGVGPWLPGTFLTQAAAVAKAGSR